MLDLLDYPHGISALDAGLGRPRLTAIHLIVHGGRVAIVDTGAAHSVPRVLAALATKGLAPEAVEYVILTHVHLDHAGGAGALMRVLPNAKLTAHPRGARHMIAPDRLIAGTIDVYGEAHMQATYGEVVPVPEERVIETGEGTRLALGDRVLHFFDAPGHARHHVVIHDPYAGAVFTGDTFGLAYSELDDPAHRYIFPTTSPTQFDPAAAHRSVDRIAGLADTVYVTHYGAVHDVAARAADLHRLIDAHAALALAHRHDGAVRHERLRAGIVQLAIGEAERRGWQARRDEVLHLMNDDIELNAQGLGCWLDALPPQ